MDLFELNEAFAAQSLAVVKDLGCDPQKVSFIPQLELRGLLKGPGDILYRLLSKRMWLRCHYLSQTEKRSQLGLDSGLNCEWV